MQINHPLDRPQFWTEAGTAIPAVSAEQMREVDRIAVAGFGLGLLQMMENAGRNLASLAMERLGSRPGRVAVLAGSGGNGGGGLCCGRHLLNHGIAVDFVLDRPAEALRGAAVDQWRILAAAGAKVVPEDRTEPILEAADLVLDALIGYSLQGAPRGRVEQLIELCNSLEKAVIALDLPSGLDATSGERAGALMRAEETLTLALPKVGLRCWEGELWLGDIGIPSQVYPSMGISLNPLFQETYILRLFKNQPQG